MTPAFGGTAVPFAVVALQSQSITARLIDGAAEVAGLVLTAGALAAGVALLYRWYVRERVPAGLPILFGLSAVALYLGTSRALRQAIGSPGDPVDETVALATIVTMLLAVAAARVGTDLGDRAAADVFEKTATRVDGEVGRMVQVVGRVITVELPEEIDDIVGYDPVPDETKEALAGRSFVFPRRLTVGELRDRLVTRLKADYAVGHVDLDLSDDATVEYLALGSRAAGIGPTLPPETSAVAVRADPAFAASAGDLVQVWETRPPERVLTAELRGRAGDVVTLAVDAADTRRLDDDTTYKLVTLPVESRPDREFASLLRAADETMAAVTVAAGSPLAEQPLGALDVTVAAIRPTDGPVEPLPGRERVLGAGDTLYLVATPDAIRKVDAAVRAAAQGVTDAGTPSAGSEMPADRRVDATTPVAGDAQESDPVSGTRDGSPDAESVEPDESGDGAATDGVPEADLLDDEDVPAIQALEDDRDDEDTGDDEDGHEDEAAASEWTDLTADGPTVDDSDDGDQDAESADAESTAGETDDETVVNESATDEPTTEDPTTEDLSDLPGTDPDEFVGTGIEGLDDVDDEATSVDGQDGDDEADEPDRRETD